MNSGKAQDHGICARDVRPGMIVRNPYGGARGRGEVVGEPRQGPDGTIEFDLADGRTGRFRPGFRLDLDTAAPEPTQAEREADSAPAEISETFAGHEPEPGTAKAYAATHRVLCAHADRDGQGMHWLAPGEICGYAQAAAVQRPAEPEAEAGS